MSAAREALTPEQRWTSGVAVLLTVAILLFGHPSAQVLLQPGEIPTAGAAPGGPAADGGPGSGPVDGAASSPVPQFTSVPETSGPPASGLPPIGATVSPPPLKVVALVVPGGPPGRDDEAAARAFLGSSDLDVAIVSTAGPPQEVCDAAAADVVLASLTIDRELRRCLVRGGSVIVAFDSLGSVAETPGGGALVSTRRGPAEALGDAVAEGLTAGVLDGPTGIVAASALRSVVEGSLARWQALGLEVVETEFVADDAAPSPEGVARFAAAGVDAVLFAVPAATARQWALQHSVLDPSVRYVIGDTFDAVWAERHPPVFDGALTSTSLVVPWLAREQGETGVQAACREEWEAQVQPPVLLEGEETVRVFSWCLHVGLVESLGAVADPAAALRRLAGPSPLTSDLGPRPGRPWGPRTAALLVWRAACGCWESSETP